MDSFDETSTSLIEDFMTYNSNYINKDDSILTEQLADFDRLLRISALTKAAEMSPRVTQATIGPNSPTQQEVQPETVPPAEGEVVDQRLLLQDILKDDLRYNLIIKEYKSKFQEASQNIYASIIDRMVKGREEKIKKFKEEHVKEYRKTLLEMKKIQMIKELHANDNLTILENAKSDQQKNQLLYRKRLDNINKALEEQNKAATRFAAITDSHTKILTTFNEIVLLMNTHPYSKDVSPKYVTPVNTVLANINAIMRKERDTTTDKEVKLAEVLVTNITNIRTKMIEELNAAQQEEIDKKLREEEELKQKELQQKLEEKRKAAELAQAQKILAKEMKKGPIMFHSPKNLSYYEELKNFLVQYEAQYKDLLENSNFKKFRFDCQKAVNTPVNAISSVSGIHMRDKYDKLSKLLKGERVQVLDTYVEASKHPQGLAYCTALLAKKIVRQGDLLVSSKPEAAFPLAAITVALWTHFPLLGKLLEAYFHMLCPYLVPMFLPQKEGQTDKEFYISRGYTYNEDGTVEKQDKFLKRMSGIFTLRCAIWIAKTPRFINGNNPHGLQFGWNWLASFLNLKPEPDICATLLHNFFTVCGSEFYKHYGKQFTKIIKLTSTEYLKILQNIDEGGPKTRLEVFLQNVLKTGFIEPPVGILDANIW